MHVRPEPAAKDGLHHTDRLLTPPELALVVTSIARQKTAWREQLRFPDRDRWYGLWYASPTVEVWLLTWQQDTSTELHDHGDSSGAFCVVAGELEEIRGGTSGRLHRRRLRPGEVGSFSAGYVHDLANRQSPPAVSVHAYSPPLTCMTFYERAGAGLAPARTEHYGRSEPLSAVRGRA
ncbi:MAG TPA: cysteine dioxygenase family protein [Frankiaceae bacterium]|nr:cysteine dioxygenase family protein [Frankiaceae bacterium]